jgi:hypothetical protein
MSKIIVLLLPLMLMGCATRTSEPHFFPKGNMPMTQQEYQEAQSQLRQSACRGL